MQGHEMTGEGQGDVDLSSILFSTDFFAQVWRPDVMLFVVIVTVGYVLVTGPWRVWFSGAQPVSRGKKAAFLSGLLVFYLAYGSPLHYLAMHYLFSAHMLQYALLSMVMVPLILMGIPDWWLRPLLRKREGKRLVILLTKPFPSVVLFSLFLSFIHFPLFVNAMARNMAVMNLITLGVVVTAFMMWWSVVPPLKGVNPLSSPMKMVLLGVAALLLIPSCALIIFANVPLYEAYEEAPRVLSWLVPLTDQQLGGVVMKLGSELFYGIALGLVFFQWVRSEKEKEAVQLAEIIPMPAVPPKADQTTR